MPFRQIATLAVIGLFIIGLSNRLYTLSKERNTALRDLHAIQEKAAVVEADRLRIDGQADFLSNPDNLEKELRSRMNYRAPDEKVIIIVPAQETSTTSTADDATE